MDYLPLYIKVGTAGAYSKSMEYEEPFDTRSAYGLWIKHIPYMIMPQIKEPITQTWNDEDGDDVYLPLGGVKCEAYDLDVDFVFMSDFGDANIVIPRFVSRIKGKWLRLYDSYTRTVRDGVFVKKIDDTTFRSRKNKDIIKIRVKFRVNNPNFNGEF